MSNLLGSIFGFGNKMKRRLRDAVSNPSDYAEMTADENRNEWRKNPDERSLGFFNPVPLGTMGNFVLRKELGDAVKSLKSTSSLPKEVIEKAIQDFPEVPKKLLKDYMELSYKTRVAEKTSDPATWTEVQNKLYDSGDWRGFSRSRGYSEKEIADFAEMLSLHKKLREYLPEKVGPFDEIYDDLGSIDAFLIEPYAVKAKENSKLLESQSRRDFLKKSAGLAGGTAAASIPGAKLLQKFAPEERALAKEAVTEAAPKYKYNSLKEYLDDITDYSHDIGHERAYESAMKHGYNNHPGANRYMDDFVDNFDFSKIQRERLLQDEIAYKNAKGELEVMGHPEIDPISSYKSPEEFDSIKQYLSKEVNKFSPQAKKEMKALKEYVNEMNTGKQPRPEGTGIYQNLDWADPKNIERYIMLGVP